MLLAPAVLHALLGAVSAAGPQLCPGVEFKGDALRLSDAERRRVCGDPESEVWKDLPRSQVEKSLRAYLQQRAYHFPTFTLRGPTLLVDPGRKVLVTKLTGRDFPPGLDLGKRRRVVGRPLTPALLDSVREGTLRDLQNRGYACPEVAVAADAVSGELGASFLRGDVFAVDEVVEPVLDGVDSGIFRRYEAFERGEPMDRRLLSLTSDRIVNEALFLSSSYDVSCGTAGVRLVHRATPAPPRLLRLGVGVDTEGFFRARASWKHSRIGWRANTSQATLEASSREQSFEAFMRWFLGPSSRWHLVPRAVAARTDEARFETRSAELSLMPAVTFDDQRLHGALQAGPAVQFADTVRGVGPEASVFMTFNTHAELTTHSYEYFQRDPRSGTRAEFNTASRVSDVSSELTAHRLRLSVQKLWNLGAYDPPLAVLGSRGWVGTTVIGDRQAAVEGLPPAFRFFLGGDGDFRGVGRGELGDELGYLTAAYHGLELRSGDLLPYRLQPLVFLDAAMAGRTPLHLERDVYYAPGFGARWATFVGAFRVTFARSLLWRRDPATAPSRAHWQFFFSYGREF